MSLALFGAVAAPMAVPVAVYAQLDCEGIQDCADQGAIKTDPANADEQPGTKIDTIITTVINIFSLIVGVIAVIMIIIGGLKYITSGGDSGNITAAKNTILYAVIGLVVVALAQFVVRFVLDKVSG